MSPFSSLLVLLLVGCAAAQFRFTTTNTVCDRFVQWNRLALFNNVTIPHSRFDPAVVVDPTTNKLYVTGGTTSDFNGLDDVFEFNAETVAWTEQERSPIGPLSDHSATFLDGSIVIFGGKNGENGLSNKVLYYHIANNTWTTFETTNTPEPRYGHSAQHFNGKLFIFGGAFSNDSVTNELWSLNLTSFEWTQHVSTETPYARLWHSTVLLNNKWILYGGYNNVVGGSDVWSFDFTTLQWTEISATSPLDPRSGHVAVVLEEQMFVIGGEFDYYPGLILNNNDVWSFNPATTEWTHWCSVGTSIHPRLGARGDVATLGDTTGALIFGGVTTNSDFSSIYTYDDLWAMSLVPHTENPTAPTSPTSVPTGSGGVPVKVPTAAPHSNNAVSISLTGVALLVIAATLI